MRVLSFCAMVMCGAGGGVWARRGRAKSIASNARDARFGEHPSSAFGTFSPRGVEKAKAKSCLTARLRWLFAGAFAVVLLVLSGFAPRFWRPSALLLLRSGCGRRRVVCRPS